MALTEAEKRAQKKYNEKTITIAASYKPGTDILEGKRVKAYLAQAGMSMNSYIKRLIKTDLDNKGIPYPYIENDISDQDAQITYTYTRKLYFFVMCDANMMDRFMN